jgi:protein SCO1
MNSNSLLIQWITWGLLGAVIVGITVFFFLSRPEGEPLPVHGQVPPFAFTNQLGQTVSDSSLRGQVWLADIIFTRCPLICARITRNMAEVQAAVPKNAPVKFISLTADPEYDTPAVLHRYADKFSADPQRWFFLTGAKREINTLAMSGLKLAVQDKAPEIRESPEDLFIHSAKFVLVDKQGRLRAWFDGELAESRPEILQAINSLLREK